jgi:hypothetical protein
MTPDKLIDMVARTLGAEPSNPLIRKVVAAAILVVLEEADDAVLSVGDHAMVGDYANAIRALMPKSISKDDV